MDHGDAAPNRVVKWLTRQLNSSDSLRSEKDVDRLIARLPLTPPETALHTVTYHLENVDSLEVRPSCLPYLLKRLDEHSQEPLAGVIEQLFEHHDEHALADTHWLALARFYRSLHTSYRACLRWLAEHAPQDQGARADALLIACRAMAALGRYKAILRMRYRGLDAQYWEHAISLAASSNTLGSYSTLVELYRDTGCYSSVEREHLIALLFEAAPLSNLLPAQMLALDILLRRLAPNYRFADTYSDATPFVLDIGAETGVKRWLKGLRQRPGQPFFGPDTAYDKLIDLRARARASTEVPDWLDPAKLSVESYLAMLDLLVDHWSAQPPQRQHRRERTKGDVIVASGISQVRRLIAASEYAQAGALLSYDESTPYDFKLFGKLRFGSVVAKTTEGQESRAGSALAALRKFELEGDRQMTELLTVCDKSASGLGVEAPPNCRWARVGALMGIRNPEHLEWTLAVVRRVNRSPNGKSVGLQIFPAQTLCARLQIGPGDQNNPWAEAGGSVDAYHEAILLQYKEFASVLLPPGVFGTEAHCMISFQKRWQPATLVRRLERGYQYEEVLIDLPAHSNRPAP